MKMICGAPVGFLTCPTPWPLANCRMQPRIEGKVEIRPSAGYSAPVNVSIGTHQPAAARNDTSRGRECRETTPGYAQARRRADVVGKEVLLFRTPQGRNTSVIAMDLPFVLFIPFGRRGQETNRRIPPASIQLPSRTAETFYELVVTVQQGASTQNRYAFPIPLQRYDTLSTFGMYNRPENKVVGGG